MSGEEFIYFLRNRTFQQIGYLKVVSSEAFDKEKRLKENLEALQDIKREDKRNAQNLKREAEAACKVSHPFVYI